MESNVCPHLVNIAQGKGRPTFISSFNRCRAGGREAAIGGTTQARLCLTAEHKACPFATGILKNDRLKGPRQVIRPERVSCRPSASVHPLTSTRYREGARLLAGLVLIVSLIAGLMTVLPRVTDGQAVAAPLPSPTRAQQDSMVAVRLQPSPTPMPPTVTPTATPIPPTSTPTDTPTPTATPTATPTFTPTPTATATPTPLRPLALSPPTRLVIPALNVDISVVEVGWKIIGEGESAKKVWVVADYAAGFHRTSAYPGRPGNTVISGHNNIRGEVFRDLETLAAGDEVTVYVGETVYPYQVAETHILPDKWVSEEQKQENAKWIGYFPEERLTLVTCWPYEGNSHRVIVVAKPVEPPDPLLTPQ
jgi:sortase A